VCEPANARRVTADPGVMLSHAQRALLDRIGDLAGAIESVDAKA
jgi:hypothetical protein